MSKHEIRSGCGNLSREEQFSRRDEREQGKIIFPVEKPYPVDAPCATVKLIMYQAKTPLEINI